MVDYYYPDTILVTRKQEDGFGDDSIEDDIILNYLRCSCQSVSDSEKSLVTSANYKVYYSTSIGTPLVGDEARVIKSNGNINGTIKLIDRGLDNGRVLWIEANGN